MSRVKWKLPSIISKNISKKDLNVISSRNSIVTPSFVNKQVKVHNGKIYNSFVVTSSMMGRKFGEFSPTKKTFTFKKKK